MELSVTTSTSRYYHKLIFAHIAFVMMILFGFLLAIVTNQRTGRWHLASFNKILDGSAGCDFIIMFRPIPCHTFFSFVCLSIFLGTLLIAFFAIFSFVISI